MKTRTFGPTGEPLALIGQGTWNMEDDDAESAIMALRRGLDAGMTHVDTAELYGDGSVEQEIVRPALAGRREEAFLVSKVLPTNASKKGTIEACERSLRRLDTDHLDCYLLHWPGGEPLEDTIAAFEQLVEDGKIRYWGVSNFDEEELAEAVRIAGADRIACNQVLYHLEERSIEHAILPYCEEQGIAVVAYSPFGSGRFPEPSSKGGKVLEELGRHHDVSAHQIALAFLTRRESTFAIPKASSTEHALDNAEAAHVNLTHTEVARIDEAFPRGPRKRGVPSL